MSPTQYDWPAPHCGEHIYPWPGVDSGQVELGWTAGYGHEIANQWFLALQSWRAGDATRILTGACFKEAALVTTTAGVRFDARIDPAQDPPLPRFSLVLFAMGLGEEQCVVDGHGGPAFWDADRICETNMGLDRPAHVLISGGGDGALQDFIRAVTGERSVLDIYQRLPLSASDKQRIEQTVFWAEDQYQRGAVWSTGNWDCELLTPLKIAYERLVESLPEAFWGELPTRVRIRVPEEFTIRLVHSCQHFSRCYPLNHFVARVLGTYLARLAAPPFVEGMRVSGIESTACNGAGCHGKPHLARLIESRRRGERDTVQDAGRLDADVLLIRHGIRPPSPLTDAAFGVSRQMLPYYMPWGPPR